MRFTEATKGIKSTIPSASGFPAQVAGYHDTVADTIHGAIGPPMFALLVDGALVDSWRGAVRSDGQILAEADKACAAIRRAAD